MPAYLPTYIPTCLPACPPTYISACLSTYLPACLPANLLTHLHTYLPAYLPLSLSVLDGNFFYFALGCVLETIRGNSPPPRPALSVATRKLGGVTAIGRPSRLNNTPPPPRASHLR